MIRYNCKLGPVDMEESVTGYWVTYADYERVTLDCNKKLERTWQAETDVQAGIHQKYVLKLEAQNNLIVKLSIAVFALGAFTLFKLLS